MLNKNSSTRIIGIFAILFICSSLRNTTKSILPDLKIFTFKSKESKIVKGLSTEKASGYNCSGTILDDDIIENIALVSQFYQNGCYTDGQYNHSNFKVEYGTVADAANEQQFDAYKIYEPASKASKFLASNHCVFYRFATRENYSVYELDGSKINKIVEISASNITPNQFVPIKELVVSSILGSRTFFFAPSSTKISSFTKLSENVEGARIKKTALFDLEKYRFQTNYTPLDFAESFENGRVYFPMSANNQLMIVWQGKDNSEILLSTFANDLKSEKTVKLPNPLKAKLIAATCDNSDNIYFCTISKSAGSELQNVLTLFKANLQGKLLGQETPKTDKSNLDIYNFGNYMADLQFADGKLGLFIARTMNTSGDGLNHQGGIAVVFDANTLKIIRNFGQTSGHSFDNFLTINTENQFIGVDLGDNYPRGINLHKFNDSEINSRVIYTFKTEHGMSAQSPAGATYPAYPEISISGKKYYKWSNDNGTYTSLGAMIEANDGYIVVFTGEPDANGKSINNSRVGEQNTDPRNIGFIKIVKDFETKSGSDNEVTDDLVLSKGITETGGFFTFGGWWSKQRNTGVQWLTSYKDKANGSVENLKAVKLQDNNILLLWELSTIEGYDKKYITSFAMKIDGNGKKLSEPIDIGSHIRLSHRDDLLCIGNQVFTVMGSETEKKLELAVFEIK